MVLAYRRVQHVVETGGSVVLFLPFVLREVVVALLACRYFALMMMSVSLAFQTVLVLALLQPPGNAQALAVPTPVGLVIRTLTVLVVDAGLGIPLLPSVVDNGHG